MSRTWLLLICLISLLLSSVMPILPPFMRSFPPLFPGLLYYLNDAVRHQENEPKSTERPLSKYDFIIVGAGTAGCVLANRLSEIGEWKVLLIEAGREENFIMDVPILANLLQFSEINWKYKTVPSTTSCLGLRNRQCNIPRGKVMGGSSVLNYMIYTRGNRRDYDLWSALGNTGWSYQEVLPYFLKVENVQMLNLELDEGYHGQSGYMTVSDVPFKTEVSRRFVLAGLQYGFRLVDYNGRYQQGFNFHQATMKNGTRMSSSRAYLHPIRYRRNLHVVKYSRATRVLIDPLTKAAIGVEFIRARRKYRVMARKEVILSAGAINSPHLLSLSGIGPKADLQRLGIPVIKDLPVGYNLMDHVALGGLTFLVDPPISLNVDRLLSNANTLYDFMRYRNGAITIPGGSEALGFIDLNNPNDPDGYPDLELLLASGTVAGEPTLRASFNMDESVYDRVYRQLENRNGFTVFPMIMRPKSRGRVYLNNSNPLSWPLIDMGYFSDESDLDIAVAGAKLMIELTKTPALREVNTRLHSVPLPGCQHLVFGSDDYWKCHARQLSFTIYHQSGTCKMGPVDDGTSVVDPRLKVYGVNSLRVVDASVFPEIPAGHPNAPVLMIAEKASDLIKQDWNVI